jgi:hypothetical protein
MMTKLPWQGKETKANHEVFVATKPGQCISVDQMMSTEVGFYAQLNIMYASHQIAKYSSDPRQSHGEAILYLVRYLKKTRNLGLKFKPDPKIGFKRYCDTDFSGNWNKEFAPVNPSTAKSQSGWIIFYAGCPISWAFKLQSQIALSTNKAKYIAMSQALPDVIPVTNLLQEMREQNFKVVCIKPYVYCLLQSI